MSDEQKLLVPELSPQELIEYQKFYQAHGQMLAEIGRLWMEHQAMLDQAKASISQLIQTKENWTLRALSQRGINPISGKWEIDPQTGKIINIAKLRVAES
jgi:hypothetical protein